MTLMLMFSPCPNDTFIFDALIHEKIDTEGLRFDYRLEDIETLNRMALTGRADVIKVSYGVLSQILPDYQVLDAGSALGRGTGPLLVARSALTMEPEHWMARSVVLPGAHTTAHLLFNMAFPEVTKKIFVPFHAIEDAVVQGTADAGVIIHENRFTYEKKGLVRLADLGDLWETQTGFPVPLGGIVGRRELPAALCSKVNRVIRKSIDYALERLPVIPEFVRQNAQEMDEEVMRAHISLYVNHYTRDLGSEGRAAVWKLLEASSFFHPPPVAGSFEVFL